MSDVNQTDLNSNNSLENAKKFLRNVFLGGSFLKASTYSVSAISDILTVTNDNPCVTSGNWTAVSESGHTYYTNGTTYITNADGSKYEGPVNFLSISSFTVASGATVDGAMVMGGIPTITIQSGGTLQNSRVYNGFLSVVSGGTSDNNIYASIASSGSGIAGVSQGDTFIQGASSVQGTATLSQNTGFTNFTVSDSNAAMSIAATGKVFDPITIVNDTSSTAGSGDNFIFTLAAGAYYGPSQDYNVATAVNSSAITIANDLPCIQGGDVTAYLGADGYTYYRLGNTTTAATFQVNGVDYHGAVNMINVGNLYISNGATVDGANIFGLAGLNNTNVRIQTGGTLKNSSAYNGYLYMDDGSASIQNKYFSMVANTGMKGTSDTDYVYGTASGTTGTLSLTGANAPTNTSFYVGDASGNLLFNGQIQLNNVHILNQGGSSMTATFNNGMVTTVCYLTGTMIRGEFGDISVEALKIGDKVQTYWDGVGVLKEIVWVGHRHYYVNASLPDDIGGYPVRILKDALAEGVPYKDLLVTPEHCLFINGGFVPARMLVNGRSIYYDHSITSYEYYHVELEDHSVIMADGVLSESYLDTDNHQYFRQEGNVISLRHGGHKVWEKDSVAPLTTSREVVEPVYHQLARRAEFLLGACKKVSDVYVTHDPAICLYTDKGGIVYPRIHSQNDRYAFVIPADVEHVYLHSLSSRPCDVIGSFVDDRRNLGILVGEISLFEGDNAVTKIDQHLKKQSLQGWHSWENDTCRWTDGHASLHLGKIHQKNSRILVIKIVSTGTYALEQHGVNRLIA